MKIERKMEILEDDGFYRLKYYDKKNKVTITTPGFNNKNQMCDVIKKDTYFKLEKSLDSDIKENTIKHKKHSWKRETVCGIKYDNTIIHIFIPKSLVGHWNKVTCKKCLKSRNKYEKELKLRVRKNEKT